jgi:hypothetical protein
MNMRVLAQAKPAAQSVIPPVRSNLVLQRRATDRDPVTAVPPIVRDVLNSPGQPLDPATRAFIEPRFGHDFGHVRVHTNAKAADSARAVHAHAYTVGSNVVFGANEFAPATHQGRELLAHELAHTIQQRSSGAPLPSSDPSGIFESSANAAARSVASGGNVSPSLPACGQQIQRSPDGDARWKNNVRAARYRGQVMANRIKKHGLLSREARAKINQELAYFEGDAKEAYLREVKPVLFQTVPIEMPAERVERKVPQPSITWSLVQPDPNRISDEQIYAPVIEAKREEAEAKKTGPEYAGAREYAAEMANLQEEFEAEPEHTEQETEEAGMRAYYLSTRQSQLEAAGTTHATVREQVWHMTPKEIYSQWESGKTDFAAVASSPVHTLKAEQVHQIWLRLWDDRFKHGETTRIRIARREADADFGEYYSKIMRYHNGERNALGSEFADAYEEEESARIMFRQSVFIMEYLRAADAQGKNVTLDEINKLAVLQDKFTIKTEEFAIVALAYADFVGRVPAVPGASVVEESASPNLTFPRGTDVTNRGAFQAPDVVTPSRPVAGFKRDIVPKPAPVVVPPGESVSTQMPPARVVQGNQPTVGNLKPAFETQGPPATPSPRVTGFKPPPKDIAEKPGLIEAETGPREYVKREYLGDRGAAGEQQSRYHVNVQLDKHGMMDSDFVLRGGGKRSGSLSGKDEFLAAKQHFEQQNGAGSVKGAYGRWGGGDNLDTFNTRYTVASQKGFSHNEAMIEAARRTKTGEWAKAAGFNNVKITKAEGSAGAYTNVEVEFTK